MGLFDFLFGSDASNDEPKRDRYGHDRENGQGPRVQSGPTKGLLRARNKDGTWGRKHNFD